jgi:hypothetical protein
VELTIGIGHAHIVEIHEHKIADGVARKRLGCKRTDPTHSKDHDPRRHQPMKGRLADQARSTVEAAVGAHGGFDVGLGGGGRRGAFDPESA